MLCRRASLLLRCCINQRCKVERCVRCNRTLNLPALELRRLARNARQIVLPAVVLHRDRWRSNVNLRIRPLISAAAVVSRHMRFGNVCRRHGACRLRFHLDGLLPLAYAGTLIDSDLLLCKGKLAPQRIILRLFPCKHKERHDEQGQSENDTHRCRRFPQPLVCATHALRRPFLPSHLTHSPASQEPRRTRFQNDCKDHSGTMPPSTPVSCTRKDRSHG